MKVQAFAIAGDRFRIRIDAGPDGSCALGIVNDETDLVLHFDSGSEAAQFGEDITALAQAHIVPARVGADLALEAEQYPFGRADNE